MGSDHVCLPLPESDGSDHVCLLLRESDVGRSCVFAFMRV